ncbi:hypothetical protein A3I27_03115 [Candidatus Giovannonibacteria bacterium RIFCSPLOWO2_02_FULL_43_11b]|uniref:Pilus assembly protein PilO n=1 Tax=Candidatus Giovannonibacteria bacterium RIFCSPHIGHO2_12_FULL_43_15 TaxID=1798341 RepID=A0A1F5WNZ0_9BACT|nr:MAG: hypothetical protein A2739_01355 [Candidatus Giovannonibacteria bacterium RIFCSPHIGHO2_01_FULL_43_100]OGF67749.1 MAG: hypothetical protein A3B97_01570 [Candidatus Giovannonibacteria bacterium RIFCSPHIGHO2_02_FULL_43_32]OGF77422.1 MAG: hypothetical protein A3F23_01620 [Candidatus Giovannonibacteria bacterium RIFCSPHIGHO2_12_FULL_43_15]OGF79039.1 MAG: hypothetical protein A3A15_03250 [Candidatus Giovannonibacteria bacterium RIFCSPLOWO2_01_FULL_43_60]OGF89357.1 MAG: hypothetical protein A3
MARSALGVTLILLSVLVGVFWSYPMWNEISVIKAKKEEIQSTLDRINALARKRDEIQEQYNSLSPDDLVKLNEFFPKNQELGLLILNIDKIVSSNGMILKKINASENNKTGQQKQGEEVEERFSDFPFQISVSGSYNSFLSFMKALEKSRRLIDIDRLTFDSGSVGADGKIIKSDFYEYSISAHTYWKK